MPKSQFPWWLGTIGLPFPSPQSPEWPLEASPRVLPWKATVQKSPPWEDASCASFHPENFSSHSSKPFPCAHTAPACLQLLYCWPHRTTQECQQFCVLPNPGWMFSTYSLISLRADYCLTFLERQLEAPANFYDILKLHICLMHLLLPSPRASCFSCHSSFHAGCREMWVISIIYGTSQHLHGKSIRSWNSCSLTPAAWMFLPGGKQP